jgi:hypothetical protein
MGVKFLLLLRDLNLSNPLLFLEVTRVHRKIRENVGIRWNGEGGVTESPPIPNLNVALIWFNYLDFTVLALICGVCCIGSCMVLFQLKLPGFCGTVDFPIAATGIFCNKPCSWLCLLYFFYPVIKKVDLSMDWNTLARFHLFLLQIKIFILHVRAGDGVSSRTR